MPKDQPSPFESPETLYVRGKTDQSGAIGSAPPSLFEPRFKCAWAEKHLQSLKTQIDFFVENNPYSVVDEVDADASQYVIKIVHPNILKGLPSVMTLGDFAHCLRASLDYVAWQLALLSGEFARREVSFPIIDKYTFDSHQFIAKTTFGIPDAAVAIMKSFQPYSAGDAYMSTHLFRLSALCNVDKHRHISIYSAIPSWQWCISGYDIEGQLLTEQIDNCTIMRLPLPAKDHVTFNPESRLDLRFTVQPRMESKDRFDLTYQDLIDMHQFVRDTVIPAFSGFFPNAEELGEPLEFDFPK